MKKYRVGKKDGKNRVGKIGLVGKKIRLEKIGRNFPAGLKKIGLGKKGWKNRVGKKTGLKKGAWISSKHRVGKKGW